MAFEAPHPTWAPVAGGGAYPVRRLFCVGRNYAPDVALERAKPDCDPPFFFTKFADTIMPDGAAIAYPTETADYHHEVELVVAMGHVTHPVDPSNALDHVFGYAVGLDMTRRELQQDARRRGWPWDAGKNVEQSSPLGLIHPVGQIGHPARGSIELSVNGVRKQSGDIGRMIWSVPEVIAYVARFYNLGPGDLIFTGTPHIPGPVERGDTLHASIEGMTTLKVSIA